MPYTVKFEVSQDEILNKPFLDLSLALLATPIPQTPARPVITNSILPSLSKAPTISHTPSGSPPLKDRHDPSDPGSAELFFHRARAGSVDPAQRLADSLNDRLAPQLVQPRSRFQLPVVASLVVDGKKKDDDIGLLSLKISRLLTALPAHPGLTRSSSSSEHRPLLRGRNSVLRQFSGFTLGNDSNSSLVIAEEEDTGRLALPASSESDGEKLAPYGGFSRPDLEETFLNQTSVFELAPWQVVKSDKGNGSMINAVKLAHEKGIIKNVKWVGTMSLPSDAIPEHVLSDISTTLHKDYDCESVVVNDITFQGHYKSFCKQILWPTLHYQIPDDPKSKAFEVHSYHHYKLLNQLVADKVVETYKRENSHLAADDPENIIWIHDYHLLLVPNMIREKLPNARIGFFLHVSFPSSEVFKCLAQRTPLLEGMLGADCVTFQTNEYVRHFLQTCSRLLLTDTTEDGLTHSGGFTLVNTIPVGIDAHALQKLLYSTAVDEWRSLITERWKGQQLIVSRDLLDKLRGVKQRLLAYERFLRENPTFVDSAVMIQIFIGHTDDDDYETEVMQLASRINSMADNISGSPPVVIVRQDIDFNQYLALLSEADVFIVSSMREGLNLTCHEFIVAAERKKSPLVLSEFTGSSTLLHDGGKGALLINPWDKKAFSETIKRALVMKDDEKIKRWNACNGIVATHDSMDWIKSCLKSINDAWVRDSDKMLTDVTVFTSAIFDQFYQSVNGRRLFFIDLDESSVKSTLYGGKSGSQDGYLEFSRVGRLLTGLISDTDNVVYVRSVMKRSDLDLIFKNTPNIGLVAENGGFVKLVNELKWLSILDENEVNNWKPQVAQMIKSKVERLPGSTAIIEDCTVRLLADTSMAEDPKRSLDVMGDCIQHINDSFEESEGVHATIVGNSVVVLQKNILLRALNLLLAIYTTDISISALTEQYKVKRVLSATDALFQSAQLDSSNFDERRATRKVRSLFVAGGLNPIDETVFDSISSFEKEGVIEKALAVAVRGNKEDVRTSATYSVSGINELFSILSKARQP